MTNISQLRHDAQVILRALARDKQGFDADGFNAEGFNRAGLSRETVERHRQEMQAAFESLMPEQQDLVAKSNRIIERYEQQAIAWEAQPDNIKRQDPVYEDYKSHSDCTKHSCLLGHWWTDEEKKLCLEAHSVWITARNKLLLRGGLH